MLVLASVVDPGEVAAAVEGGADIVDVKNPAEGSLGAAEPDLIRRVRALAPVGLPVSAAIGDAPPLPGTMALAALGAASCGADYVKVGLYGTATPAQAEAVARAVRRAVEFSPFRAKVIATGYADAADVGAVEPRDLPAAAARAGAHGCMLDTIAKNGGTLFDFLSREDLADFVSRCRDLGMVCALAGSLAESHADRLLELGADIAGFRSAVCNGDRAGGRVDADRVRRLKALLGG